ncbi:MAG: Multidrug export protein EmrA [Chlamydiae bacterium]|nr:Multidrug export protein EmrA [Chlamydiota bacterium]
MEEKRKRRFIIGGMVIGLVVVGIAVFLYWLFIWQFEEWTDDAYVHGNQVVITPQISGFITSLTVEDTEVVEKDRILVTLDKTDNTLALLRAESELAVAVRDVVGLFQRVGELKAAKEMRKSEMIKAAQDYTHRKNLVKEGAVSKEEFEHSESFLVSAIAGVLFAEHQLRAALAEVENTTVATHPLVEKVKELYRRAWVDLNRCEIRAPVHGMVSRKKAQVGEAAAPSDPLLELIPLDQIWVEANYKEVNLKNVRLGQPAKVTADLWGDSFEYSGKVIGISAATGSVLSLLPPQNATGNWIKIVQRLPVRIALNPEDIEKRPLRLGVSMKVTIDTHDRSGKLLPAPPPAAPLFQTDVYNQQLEGSDAKIEQIIQKNSSFTGK